MMVTPPTGPAIYRADWSHSRRHCADFGEIAISSKYCGIDIDWHKCAPAS
jgi:hypothetical protein